jgi:hypothetical protein
MSIPILSSTIALRPRFLPTGAQSASLREEKSIISIAHDGKWLFRGVFGWETGGLHHAVSGQDR